MALRKLVCWSLSLAAVPDSLWRNTLPEKARLLSLGQEFQAEMTQPRQASVTACRFLDCVSHQSRLPFLHIRLYLLMMQSEPTFFSVYRELGITLSSWSWGKLSSIQGFSFYFCPSESKPLVPLQILCITFMFCSHFGCRYIYLLSAHWVAHPSQGNLEWSFPTSPSCCFSSPPPWPLSLISLSLWPHWHIYIKKTPIALITAVIFQFMCLFIYLLCLSHLERKPQS